MAALFSFCSCGEKMKDEDFVGAWKAPDGAMIELKSDGKFIARNIDFSMIRYAESEFINKQLSFEGKWYLSVTQKMIELESESTYADYGIENTYLNNGEKMSRKLGISFNIEGSGLLKNNLPWSLVVFIGDPDELNKYKFVKQ